MRAVVAEKCHFIDTVYTVYTCVCESKPKLYTL